MPSPAISRNFAWSEFACHSGEPVPEVARRGVELLVLDLLQPARKYFGRCTVVSGYRTPAQNQKVHGAEDSRHVYTKHPTSPAADVWFATGTVRLWAEFFEALQVGGLGTYLGHVHVDQRTERARWQA